MRLKDKIAIVTGAAHGIGRAIAELFAEEGAIVVIADLDRPSGQRTADEIRAAGGEAIFVSCDVSAASQVKRTVKRVLKQHTRVDVLCNNAAYIARKWHSSHEAPDEE